MIQKIDQVMAEITGQLGITAKLEENKTFLIWGESVGEDIAKNTQPAYIANGILFIYTTSPVWAHQLTIKKNELLEKLNERLIIPVKELRFQPKGLSSAND